MEALIALYSYKLIYTCYIKVYALVAIIAPIAIGG